MMQLRANVALTTLSLDISLITNFLVYNREKISLLENEDVK